MEEIYSSMLVMSLAMGYDSSDGYFGTIGWMEMEIYQVVRSTIILTSIDSIE